MPFLCREQAADLDFIAGLLNKETKSGKIKTCPQAGHSFAYEVNGRRIVRFPKNTRSYTRLCKEQKMLELLNTRCALQTPRIIIGQSNGYTYWTHRKIAGGRLTSAQLFRLPLLQQQKFCADIAAFMAAMHSLTSEIVQAERCCTCRCFETLIPAEKLFSFYDNNLVLPAEELNAARNFLKNYHPAPPDSPEVFAHFNLTPDNLAFCRRKLCLAGVFGFGNCGIGNIYDDFCRLALGYDIAVVSLIAEEYCRLTGWKPDISLIAEAAVYAGLSRYCQCPDGMNLRLLTNRLQSFCGGGIFASG